MEEHRNRKTADKPLKIHQSSIFGNDIKIHKSQAWRNQDILNSIIASYHSVQKLFTYRLLSINVKIKLYGNIILLVVLYGRETCALTLRGNNRLTVVEKRDPCGVFGSTWKEVPGRYRKSNGDELHGFTPHYIFKYQIKAHELGEACGIQGG